jgi:exopolysaccharide production protein ExoQ
VSIGLWVPLIWVTVLASRPLDQWLHPSSVLGQGIEDGSAVDRNILSVLMAISLVILFKRKLKWAQWFRANPWLVVYLVFCGLSIVWSDFSGIALKRWTRALGAVMMILVVLSESDPVAALATLVRRSAYVLVPFSILLIKYYRELGIAYDSWTGAQMFIGVATDKNGLGRLCLVSGLFSAWELVTVRNNPHIHHDKVNRLICFVIFVSTVWLLRLADSATSLVGILVGSLIVVTLGLPIVKAKVKHLGTIAIATFVTVITLGLSFGFAEEIAASLGRNLTLTDRTFIWNDLLQMGTNPLLGVGYDSFWLGERLESFVQKYHVTSAHSGYLEIYLELGLLGLGLFGLWLCSVFWKAKKSLFSSFDYGRLRIAVLTVFLLYNVTESGYKTTTFICFVLLLVAIESPARTQEAPQKSIASSYWALRFRSAPVFSRERTRVLPGRGTAPRKDRGETMAFKPEGFQKKRCSRPAPWQKLVD